MVTYPRDIVDRTRYQAYHRRRSTTDCCKPVGSERLFLACWLLVLLLDEAPTITAGPARGSEPTRCGPANKETKREGPIQRRTYQNVLSYVIPKHLHVSTNWPLVLFVNWLAADWLG